MSITPDRPGGTDINSMLSEALRPLSALPQALSQQNEILRGIRALLGDTGAQDPNTRAAALGMAGGVTSPTAGMTTGSNMPSGGGRVTSGPNRGGVVLPPTSSPAAGSTASVPGGGTTVTPSRIPGPGGPVGPTPPSGGPGGGPGGPAGPGSGGGASGGSGQPGALAGMVNSLNDAGGNGLVNRGYGALVSKMPMLSIPNSIRNEYQSQINKNNYYRGIAGADQSEAFGYRFEEEKARFQYGALFNEEEARLAFKGTVAQGYNRGSDGRQGRASQKEVMDAIYAGKQQAGITPEEMLTYTGTAARTATQDMQGLVDSLDDLTESVGRAGGNAQQARANFDRAFNQGISGGMTGTAAQSYASASTLASTQLGPMFAGSNPMARLSGDANYQYLVGARMGMSSGQLTQAMSTDPMSVANAQSGMFVQYMGSYISSSNPEGWAWLQNEVQSGARSPEIIAEDFVANHFGNLDRNAYVGMAQAFGIETSENLSDPISVTRYLVKEMSGSTTGAILAGQQAKIGAMDMSGKSKTTGLTGTSQSLDEALGRKEGGGLAKATAGIMSALGQHTYSIGGDNLGGAASTYRDQAKESGTRYGGIEQVLSEMGGKADQQMVEVEATDGKRIVTMEQAIKYYPNQLQSGMARFVGGKYGGKDISAITGGVDASAKGGGITESGEVNKTRSHGYVGRTSDDYYADHPDQKPKTGWKGPKAIIDLSPRAAKFFEVTGYEDADSSGEPRGNDNGWGSRLRQGASAAARGGPAGPMVGLLDGMFD